MFGIDPFRSVPRKKLLTQLAGGFSQLWKIGNVPEISVIEHLKCKKERMRLESSDESKGEGE